MRSSSAAVLVLLSALALGAAGRAARAAEPDAKQIFLSKCALCHGKTGSPAPGFAKKGVRDFTDAEWQKSRTDAELTKSIREGRPGTMMAAFGEAYSAAEIEALVRFIRTLAAPAK